MFIKAVINQIKHYNIYSRKYLRTQSSKHDHYLSYCRYDLASCNYYSIKLKLTNEGDRVERLMEMAGS